MKIESIKIQLDSKIQELTLSTDDSKNLNFIIGDNGSGKTRTFNEIKSYFLNQNTCSEIEIKLTNGRVQHPNLMFVGEGDSIIRNLFENKKFSDEERAKIEVKANEILREFQIFEKIASLRFKNEKIIPINKHGLQVMCAASEQHIVFLASLIALIDVIEPNLPLILDGPFHLVSRKYRLKTMEILCKNVNQVLVFLTNVEFYGVFTESLDAPISSVQTFVKEKNMLGSLYFLRNNDFEKHD